MQNLGAEIEWIVAMTALFGSMVSMIAVFNVVLNMRVARANNGWLQYLATTELFREIGGLIVQSACLYVGVQSLFIGDVILPEDGLLYRRCVVVVSIIMSMKTTWSQIRYHAVRTATSVQR
jgi:hypothetical protein